VRVPHVRRVHMYIVYMYIYMYLYHIYVHIYMNTNMLVKNERVLRVLPVHIYTYIHIHIYKLVYINTNMCTRGVSGLVVWTITHTQIHTHTHLYTHQHIHTACPIWLDSSLEAKTHWLWQKKSTSSREVGSWGRDPKKCTGRDWGMGSSTIQ